MMAISKPQQNHINHTIPSIQIPLLNIENQCLLDALDVLAQTKFVSPTLGIIAEAVALTTEMKGMARKVSHG